MKVASFLLVLGMVACAHRQPSSGDADEKLVDVGGAQLRVRESRVPGRAVILIHGGPGLPGYMWTLAKRLPNAHTVEYFQRDATNSPSKGPFQVANHVEDLHRLVGRYSGSGKPILVGHSWGATLALEYAKVHSGEIEKIILISPGTMNPKMGKDFGENIFTRLGADEAKARQMFETLREKGKSRAPDLADHLAAYLKVIGPAYFYDPASPARAEMNERKLPPNEANSAAGQEINDDYWKKVYDGSIEGGLEKVRDPVVHFQPLHDVNPAKDLIAILKPRIRNYRLVELPEMGHFPWLESRPERILEPLQRELGNTHAKR